MGLSVSPTSTHRLQPLEREIGIGVGVELACGPFGVPIRSHLTVHRPLLGAREVSPYPSREFARQHW